MSARPAPILVALLLLASGRVSATPGGLDTGFGEAGIVTLSGGENNIGGLVAALPDGGVVVAGTAYERTGQLSPDRSTVLVARLRADGSLDPAFGAGGVVHHGFGSDDAAANALGLAPDGRLVVAGRVFHRATGTQTVGVMRLLPDGAFDPTFGTGGTVVLTESLPDERVADLLIETDGQVLLGGDAAFAGGRRVVLRRLDAVGAVDRTFGRAGTVVTGPDADASSNQLAALVRWPDGSFGAVAVALDDAAPARAAVARFRPDGRIERRFGRAGAVVIRDGGWPVDAVVAPDGRLLVATVAFGAFRLLADGSLDPSFGEGGLTHVPFAGPANAFSATLDPIGRLLIGGQASPDLQYQYALAVARLTDDGRPDAGFGTNGMVLTPVESTATIVALALQADGKLVAGGFADARPRLPGHVLVVARYDTRAASPDCTPASGRLLLRRSGLTFTATFDLPPRATVDPSITGVVVGVGDAVNVSVPGGAFDPRTGVGWRRIGRRAWFFPRRVLVRRVTAERIRVTAHLHATLPATTGDAPPRVVVTLPGTGCGVLDFSPDRCVEGGTGSPLVCLQQPRL